MFRRLDTLYHGTRNTRSGQSVVTVDFDKPSRSRLLLLGIVRYHGQAFAWGYGGAGPAQLALSILFDFTQDRDLANTYHQRFKWAYVEGWHESSWAIGGAEIAAWLRSEGAAIDALLPES